MVDSKAVEALQQAIRLETEGQRFYLEAAEKTQDARGKDMFRSLARDEATHLQLVQDQSQSLKKTGQWAAHPPLKVKPIDLDKPLFPKGKEAIDKVAGWASSRNLDYSIETVFKKWLELDRLKPKEIVKKPYYRGDPMVWSETKKKWFVVTPENEWLEFGDKEATIEWKIDK